MYSALQYTPIAVIDCFRYWFIVWILKKSIGCSRISNYWNHFLTSCLYKKSPCLNHTQLSTFRSPLCGRFRLIPLYGGSVSWFSVLSSVFLVISNWFYVGPSALLVLHLLEHSLRTPRYMSAYVCVYDPVYLLNGFLFCVTRLDSFKFTVSSFFVCFYFIVNKAFDFIGGM